MIHTNHGVLSVFVCYLCIFQFDLIKIYLLYWLPRSRQESLILRCFQAVWVLRGCCQLDLSDINLHYLSFMT